MAVEQKCVVDPANDGSTHQDGSTHLVFTTEECSGTLRCRDGPEKGRTGYNLWHMDWPARKT